MATYRFNRNFRLKILALCINPLWMARYGSIILPEYFDQEDEEHIARAVREYYDTYGRVPNDPDDIVTMCEDQYEDIIYSIFNCTGDSAYVIDMVIQFAREQAAKIAILDSVDDVNAGKLHTVIVRMEQALAVGQSVESPGIDLVHDVDKWLYSLWSAKVRTGWTHIDAILEGGLGPGELGIILAPTNRGKSMALINIGYGAATIGSGKNVVHITHEMSGSIVAKRYAARLMFRFPDPRGNISKYEDEFIARAKKILRGRVRIIDLGRCAVEDIRHRLDILVSEGFRFDLIIDDYPDLIVPPSRRSERRFELSDIYSEMYDISKRYGVPVWAASQSTRNSFSKEVITMRDVAEDLGKARIADVIVSICQTPEESDADQCRLFMAKVRDGKNHTMIGAKFYGNSQAIVTTGVVKRKETEKYA